MANKITEQLAAVDALKAELDSLRPLNEEQQQRVFTKLRLDWNYHSNAIEGNQLTLGETRSLLMQGLTSNGKPLKDYLDIQGHDHVITWLLGYLQRDEEFTEAQIRAIHELLLVRPYEVTAVTPTGERLKVLVELGKYKTRPNQVTTPTGEVHRFVLPEETPARMYALLQWLRKQQQIKELHPIAVSALFHHEFVSIHPFDDGNGRMARILMNLLLMQSGYPPAVIRFQDRDQYFSALTQADAGQTEPFLSFIAENVARSLELYLRGARGESVDDYDDIDKRISLMKRELAHLPEPKVYDREVYDEFVTNTTIPLLSKVFHKLSTFDELFVSNNLQLDTNGHVILVQKNLAIVLDHLRGNVASWTGGTGMPNRLSLGFNWESFKKAGLDHFNEQVHLAIQFQRLKYRIEWTSGRKSPLERLYGPALDDEDCHQIAIDLANQCYNTIQMHLAKVPR